MRRKRLLGAVVVATTTAFAACYSAHESQTQASISLVGGNSGPTTYNFGTVTTSASAGLTFRPFDASDDYYVTGVTPSGNCKDYSLTGGPPIGGPGSAHVYYTTLNMCAQSTGGGSAVALGSGSGSGSTNPGTECDYNFTATFSPTQSGATQCVYTFSYVSGTGASTIDLTLEGSGAVSGISVSPPMLSFTTPVNQTSGTSPARVQNLGSASNVVMATVDDPHFSIAAPSQFTLGTGPAGLHNVDVSCVGGSSAGNFSGTLTLTPSAGSAQHVTLSCDVENTTLDFGTTNPVNFPLTLVAKDASPDQPLTANIAGGSSTFHTLSFTLSQSAIANGVTGADFTSGQTIPALMLPYTVHLHWKPGQVVQGTIGTVDVSLDSGTPFPVSINGTAEIGAVTTTPVMIDFGPVCAGQPAPTQHLDVYNTGGAPVELTSVTSPTSPFTLPSPPTNVQVMNGHLNDVVVDIALNAAATGDLASTVTLNLDDPSHPTLAVPVKATAIPAGVASTPNSASFGGIPVDSTSTIQKVVVSNCGSGPITISDHTILDTMTGSASSEFAVVDPAGAVMLAPAQTQAYSIVMTPHTRGAKMATLSLAYSGGSTQIALDGTGLGTGGGGGGTDRQTYYACSTGTAAGLAPIALAFGLAFARRRRRR